ncbi:MAG TPA: ABC transporter substrate-binding protein [Bacteriovoracaceae bacterium]|nr:ABC transporter substrate-binding protein [Bacteriovoracaceae bacterium]
MNKLLLVLAVMTLSLSSCTKKRDLDELALRLISPQKVAGFDPIQASDMYSNNEIGKVYEGLYEFHPFKRPYELMPNLAEALPEVSKDGLTYTMRIKKGVKFQDSPAFPEGKGREMNAHDFVYSWKRLADPKHMAKGWWVFDGKIKGLNEWRDKYASAETTNYDDEIEGLKAIDDYTLQIKLIKPYPQFLYATAMPYTFVVAKEAVEHFGKEFLNHPVGTGPFVLPRFNQTNTIVYTKNPTFRVKPFPSDDPAKKDLTVPLVDKIYVEIIPESQPKWLSFQKARVDMLEIPKDNFDQAVVSGGLSPELKAKGIDLISATMLDVTFYAFNHEDPLFKNNKKLRQAMMMAYDRDEANKLFYNGMSRKAEGIIPPGLGGYDPNFKNPYGEYNVEKAKKLLAEAGYPNGEGLPEITVQTVAETTSRQMLEFFAKSMSDIGIKIKIGTNSWPELVNKVTKKQHQMYTMAWGADYTDAENFLALLYCPNAAPGSNGSNYCNPTYDKMFEKATIMQEGPERNKLYAEMNEFLAEETPWLFGFHRTRFFLTHAWLENFSYMEFTHSQFQYLGINLEKKKEFINKF